MPIATRIGLDVHVLTGPPQGTATVWRGLLGALPTDRKYFLYSYDPASTRAQFPASHFRHRRLEFRQPFLRIALLYPWLARRDRCDVFHANYYGPPIGVPGLVLTVHDVLYLDFPQYVPWRRRLQFRILSRASARAAAAVITDSLYARSRIVHHFGLPASRIHVVYPALEHSWHAPDERAVDAEWLRVERNIPRRFLVSVGRVDPRKNFLGIARVASRLRARGLTDGLVIVGPDDYGAKELARHLRSEGLQDCVFRVSNVSVSGLQAIYRRSQALVYLSFAEGFGYPPLEAMAMGTAVVASNRTSIPEVCGEGALIVDPVDEGAATEAVARVIEDEDMRRSLIARGLTRVRAFRADRMARETVGVYDLVTSTQRR